MFLHQVHLSMYTLEHFHLLKCLCFWKCLSFALLGHWKLINENSRSQTRWNVFSRSVSHADLSPLWMWDQFKYRRQLALKIWCPWPHRCLYLEFLLKKLNFFFHTFLSIGKFFRTQNWEMYEYIACWQLQFLEPKPNTRTPFCRTCYWVLGLHFAGWCSSHLCVERYQWKTEWCIIFRNHYFFHVILRSNSIFETVP
jgi:hypothetical protein